MNLFFPPLVVVQYVETGGGEEELMAGLQTEKYTQEILRAIFSGMHTVLTAALRQPGLKAEVWSKINRACVCCFLYKVCLHSQIFKDDLQQLK